ncbi:hypothetical protein H4R35_002708 [Dimargaris xerosporica]|nr:hypothetical protein H4R35_002708 [Dimargaris xerosporica]
MSDPLIEAVVRQVVAKILYVHSRYDRFRQSPLLVLCDLLVRFLQQLAIEAKHNAQAAGRTVVTFFDVLDVMEHADSSLTTLQQWCTMANWGHQSKRYNDAMRDKQAWQTCLEKYLPASDQQRSQTDADDWLTLKYRECLPDAIVDDWAVADSVRSPSFLNNTKGFSALPSSSPPLSPLSEPGPDDAHQEPALLDDTHRLFTTMARDFRAIYLDHIAAHVHDAELNRQQPNIPTHLPRLPLPAHSAERPTLPTSPQQPVLLVDEDFVDIESAGSALSPIAALEPLASSNAVPPPPVALPPPALDGNSYHSIKPFSDSAVATMIRDIQIPLGITVSAAVSLVPPRIPPNNTTHDPMKSFKVVLNHLPSTPVTPFSDSQSQDEAPTTDERTDVASWSSILVPAATLFGSPETDPGPLVTLDHTAYPIYALVKTIATRHRHKPSISLSRKPSLHQSIPISEVSVNGAPFNSSTLSGIPPAGPLTPGQTRSHKLKIVGHPNATTPVFSTVGLPPSLANRLSTPRSIAIPSSLLQGSTPLASSTTAGATATSRPPPGPSSRTPSLSTPSDHRATAYRDTSPHHTPTLKISHRPSRIQSPLAHTIDDARSPSPSSTASATKIKIKLSGLPKPLAVTSKPAAPLSFPYDPLQPSLTADGSDDLSTYATSQPKKRRKSSLSTLAPPTSAARLSPGPTDPKAALATTPPPPSTQADRILSSATLVPSSLPLLHPPATAPLKNAAVPPPGANIPPADPHAPDIIHCVCSTPFWDDSSFMISCDNCQQWFHGRCVGVVPGQDPETWLCPRCQR